ncbi:MAG: radical SAM protein [Bacteriovoracaceae bacterium]
MAVLSEANWFITLDCNYDCDYCAQRMYLDSLKEEKFARKQWEIGRKLNKLLTDTGKEWVITLTGGEPFISPHFVDICEMLTKNHKITVDTNLTYEKRAIEFSEKIDPGRVRVLFVSCHIEEREKHGDVEKFIRLIKMLKEKGFPVTVSYVLHPRFAKRFNDDEKFFKSHGIDLLPKPYRAPLDFIDLRDETEENYPEETVAILKRFPRVGKKTTLKTKGVMCNAGKDFIRVKPHGKVTRCVFNTNYIGNILDDDFSLVKEAYECDSNYCTQSGLRYAILKDHEKKFLDSYVRLRVGEYIEAKKLLRELVDETPLPSVFNNLAFIAQREGNYDHVDLYMEKAIEASDERMEIIHQNYNQYKANRGYKLLVCMNIYAEYSKYTGKYDPSRAIDFSKIQTTATKLKNNPA